MPRNKRPRPDMDVYFFTPNPVQSTQSPVVGEVIHQHTSFETHTSHLTHNHSYVTIPSMLVGSNSLIHNADLGNNAPDIDISADDSANDLPELLAIEDNEDDDEDEYPFNWMDPNFIQKRPVTKAGPPDDIDEKQPKRKPRLPMDAPLHHFVSHINTFLAEILRLEAHYHVDSYFMCNMHGVFT
ncbi:hypothetical protein BDZ94DRAFT_1312957 [Collybia nuda]|uniref:Uncharacterized protein n=1 Tax=Collybia nuda TaxID=64659 RepID=A0A9P5XXV1_9AGAR|nr:hypothetical protein BDZ94DRAFT_1312957 [Collybia nuda]